MSANQKTINLSGKEIDFKSLLIGFLLATVLFLGLGAYSGSGTQDVRIVGISTYDNLEVNIDKINKTMPVKIENSSSIPVKISEVGYGFAVPVHIKNSSSTIAVKIKEVEYGLQVPVKIKN